MLPLSTVLAMAVIATLTGCGAGFIFETFFGDNTQLKRVGLALTGMAAGTATAMFLLVHIK